MSLVVCWLMLLCLCHFATQREATQTKQKGHTIPSVSDLERVFEAIGRGLLVSVCGLLSFFTKQQHLVIQEQVSLHGLKPGQVLHLKSVNQSVISSVCLFIYH